MIYASSHPAFPQPGEKDICLWRYMDISKFEWLLKERRLFMPNAAYLGDPLEGTHPQGDDAWWSSIALSATSEQERITIERNRKLLLRFAAAFRTRYYVSCWHMNAEENPTMWGCYTTSPKSIAIQTTFSKLRDALPPYVNIGMVRYMNYLTERLPSHNMFEFITHKNECFAFEKEVRAVAMHPVVEGADQQHFHAHHYEGEVNSSFRVFAPTIDLGIIEKIILHPSASAGFAAEVASLCNVTGIPIPQRSRLDPCQNLSETACL